MVGALAVHTYARPGGPEILRHIDDETAQFVALAHDRLGFGEVLNRPGGLAHDRIEAWLEDFLGRRAERKILYWTGHGVVDDEGAFHLACGDSWADGPFDPSRSLALTDLVDRVLDARSPAHTLLVLDACSSHGHLRQALSRAVSKERASVAAAYENSTSGFAVIGTSGVGETIREGQWLAWLTSVLNKPDIVVADHSRPMHRSALYLSVPYLVEAIDREAAAEGLETKDERPGFEAVRQLPNNFLHNPHFDDGDDGDESGSGPRRWVRTAVLAEDAPLPWAEESPFLLQEGGLLEREFTGRHAPLSRLVRWLDTVSHGMQVVTGPGGSGKTALLGMLGLLSVARRRERLAPAPPPQICPRPGTLHALVSCRDRSLAEVTGAVWQALAAFGAKPSSPDSAHDPGSLVEAVDGLVRRVGALNLVFDGLDEAMPGQSPDIARYLLNRLAQTPGVKVVVGTRPRPRRRLAGPVPAETLLDVLEQTTAPLALDEDDDTRRDIASMAEAVLAAEGPYAGERRLLARREAAELLAEGSGGLFVVARLIAGRLARAERPLNQAELETELRRTGSGLEPWVRREVEHLERGGTVRATAALAPLALVYGGGLDDIQLLTAMANALDGPHGDFTPQQVRDVLESAKGGLVTVDSGAYRLAHAGYGVHVLQRLGLTPKEGHRRVHDALHARCGGAWHDPAHDYSRAFLAGHAAQAGVGRLRALLDDPEFLVHTEPDVLLPLAVTQLTECEGAALYLRVADGFRGRRDPVLRRALLRAVAFVHHNRPDGAYGRLTSPGFTGLPWTELWTDAAPEPLDLRWPADRGGARTLHWSGTSAETTLSLGVVGAVAVHAPDTGRQLLTHRAPDRRRSLRQVTDTTGGGRRTTVASDGAGVFLWEDASGLPTKVLDWAGAPTSLTAVECAGRLLVMAADRQRLWAWRWPAGDSAAKAELAGVIALPVERLALVRMAGRCFLLSSGTGTQVHEIHPAGRNAELLGTSVPLAHAERRRVRAIAALTEPVRPAAGLHGRHAWLARADGHRADVWQLTMTPGHGPRGQAGHSPDWSVEQVFSLDAPDARGVTLGYWDDRPLLVLHQGDRVAVHDLRDDRRLCSFELHGHRDPQALACAPDGSGRIAVADDAHVRVLDVAAAAAVRRRHPHRSYTERLMVELAAGPDRAPALLCRTAGRTVLAGYTEAPAADTEPLALDHDEPVTAVRAVWHEGRWLVATAFGRTVRVRSLSADLRNAEFLEDIPLRGDTGQIARGLGLIVEHDGVPSLFVPDMRHVLHRRLVNGRWTVRGEFGAVAHAIGARAMADGTTWAVVDTGRGFSAWRPGRDAWNALPLLPDGGRRTAMPALGELHVMGRSTPLLAWAEQDRIHTAAYRNGRWASRHLPYDGGVPTALVFSGSADRPLLVVCGGERTLAVYDAARAWRPLRQAVVPWRGMDVEAAAALYQEGRGVVLALQSRRRCDQLVLGTDVLHQESRRQPGEA